MVFKERLKHDRSVVVVIQIIARHQCRVNKKRRKKCRVAKNRNLMEGIDNEVQRQIKRAERKK